MIHKIIDGKLVPANLRADFPNTSFPGDLSRAVLPDDYVWVTPTTPPECSQFERVEQDIPIRTLDGYWLQQWKIIPWNDDEITQWRSMLSCGPYELAQVLHAVGLFDLVNDWANAQGGMTAFAWNRASVFKRLDPLIESARIALGKTPEEVDELFLMTQNL